MSDEHKKHSVDEHMQLLERRANVVRSRLMRAVDALDTRRHQVTELGVQAREAAPKIGLSLLGLAILAGGAVIGLRAFAKSRRERVLAYRVKRFFGTFRVEKKKPFALEVLERLALTALSVVVTEAARRASRNVIDGRFPDGRLAVGHALGTHHESMKPILQPKIGG
jgi:hypothetical protein